MPSSSSILAEQPRYAIGLFFDIRAGFFFGAEPEDDLLNPQYSTHPNPYVRLSALLEAAKRGNFSQSKHAVEVVATYPQDPSVWNAWATFVGYACPIDVVELAISDVLGRYREPPDYVLDHLSLALTSTQQLSFVPTLLDWCEQRAGTELAELMAGRLSVLLEPEWGAIYSASQSASKLRQLVNEVYRRLQSQAGTTAVAVRRGEFFSPETTARRVLDVLSTEDADREDVIDDRLILEASSGVDLRGCFQDGELQPLSAAAIVESGLENGAFRDFAPGGRYFFRRLIPTL
jgi:hypothetical protein